jgi:hypothetical protein
LSSNTCGHGEQKGDKGSGHSCDKEEIIPVDCQGKDNIQSNQIGGELELAGLFHSDFGVDGGYREEIVHSDDSTAMACRLIFEAAFMGGFLPIERS